MSGDGQDQGQGDGEVQAIILPNLLSVRVEYCTAKVCILSDLNIECMNNGTLLALSDALPPLTSPSPYGLGIQPFQPSAEMSGLDPPRGPLIAIATQKLCNQALEAGGLSVLCSSMRPAQSGESPRE